MSSLGSPNPFFIAGKKAYEVERSLRFNDGDSAYLQRTPSSAGNRQICTFSCWVKRGDINSTNCLASAYSATNDSDNIALNFRELGSGNCEFRVVGYNYNFRITNRLFRDTSAWYHIVVAFDTTQSSADDRIKVYVNGVQETSFSTSGNVTQNMNIAFNDTSVHRIGVQSNAFSNYMDGYMAEINFIDGFQYDPSYFGETNPATGQWNPKKYTGGYGTNGYYLNFSDNSGTTATTLGKDYSGNGNNFTPNNFSVAAGVGNDSVSDTPTNNFPTFNPVDPGSGSFTLSNGNLDLTTATGSSTTYANFVIPSSGKWFMEATMTNNGPNFSPWIVATNYLGLSDTTYTDSSLAYYINGQKRFNGSYSNYGATFTQNDVIGVAIDVDNNEVTFYKNGASQGAISFIFASGVDYYFAATDGSSYGSGAYSWNFGQRDFVYTQPTGFKTLCSANLPDPTIKLPNKHFDTLIWSGNSTNNRAITGLNFQPDFVWIKKRTSSAAQHSLVNSIVGTSDNGTGNGNVGDLDSASSRAEAAQSAGGFESFDANGFTLGKGNNDANADSAYQLNNASSMTYVGWNWNAGDTDGKTYTVTVVSDSGNKYRFDGFGTSAVTLDLAEGGTYIFNYPSAHPFRFSTTSDGTHGGGSEYTTGVVVNSSTQVQITVAASAPTLYYYCTIHSGMGGQVNTNSTLGSSNFDGSVQSTVKVNATAGFSIVTFSGSGNRTIGHGLGVAPKAIIMKGRNVSDQWTVGHQGLDASNAWHKGLPLNSNAATQDNATFWNDTAPTSTVFSKGSWNENYNMIAYCFSEVEGYSKFGKYTGNGSSNGRFVNTGFTPAFIIFRNTVTGHNWEIYDTKRPYGEYNPAFRPLYANHNYVEETHASLPALDILSNGFKPRSTWNEFNQNGSSIVYFAFAESPFKNARAR
jgi:hypothetical protein